MLVLFHRRLGNANVILASGFTARKGVHFLGFLFVTHEDRSRVPSAGHPCAVGLSIVSRNQLRPLH